VLGVGRAEQLFTTRLPCASPKSARSSENLSGPLLPEDFRPLESIYRSLNPAVCRSRPGIEAIYEDKSNGEVSGDLPPIVIGLALRVRGDENSLIGLFLN